MAWMDASIETIRHSDGDTGSKARDQRLALFESP